MENEELIKIRCTINYNTDGVDYIEQEMERTIKVKELELEQLKRKLEHYRANK